jgi:hypothetical protein
VKTKYLAISLSIIAILVLLAWSPWITKEYAENSVIEAFEESQIDVADGCGFNCNGCGVNESHRTLFGYSVTIEYACGLLPSDSPEYHQTTTKFVSFIGTIH